MRCILLWLIALPFVVTGNTYFHKSIEIVDDNHIPLLEWSDIKTHSHHMARDIRYGNRITLVIKVSQLAGLAGIGYYLLSYLPKGNDNVQGTTLSADIEPHIPHKVIIYQRRFETVAERVRYYAGSLVQTAVGVVISSAVSTAVSFVTSTVQDGTYSLAESLGIAPKVPGKVEEYKQSVVELSDNMMLQAQEYSNAPTAEEKEHKQAMVIAQARVLVDAVSQMVARMLLELPRINRRSKVAATAGYKVIRTLVDISNKRIAELNDALDKQESATDIVQLWMRQLKEESHRFVLFTRISTL